VVKVDIEYPLTLLHKSREMTVDTKDGMLHHYRAEPMEWFISHQDDYQYVQDLIMQRYADALESAVQQRQMRITETMPLIN